MDAPWNRRSWVFPRDPAFQEKAAVVLDLYHGLWQGQPPGPDEFVLSADEKTQIQIRERCHPLRPPAPGRSLRVEHEYRRHSTCACLAAWDVHRGELFGRIEDRSAILAFDGFVADVVQTEPYRSASRVFRIVDNGTVHRGQRAVARLQSQWTNLVFVHLPLHASRLNQVEIYFSVLQRKALTPAHFESRRPLRDRILRFQAHYQQVAQPAEWKFTRNDLHRLLNRCSSESQTQALAT